MTDERGNFGDRKLNLPVHVIGLVDNQHVIFLDDLKHRRSAGVHHGSEFFDHKQKPFGPLNLLLLSPHYALRLQEPIKSLRHT